MITMVAIVLISLSYMINYMICEMQEIWQETGNNTFTFITKTFQLIFQSPINGYFIYLSLYFNRMGQRYFRILNITNHQSCILNVLTCFLIIYYFIDSFFYVYPYIALYIARKECWSNYD